MAYKDFPKLSKEISELQEIGFKVFSTYEDDTFFKVYIKPTKITAAIIILQYDKKWDLLKQYVFGLGDLEQIIKNDGFRELMKQAIEKQERSKHEEHKVERSNLDKNIERLSDHS